METVVRTLFPRRRVEGLSVLQARAVRGLLLGALIADGGYAMGYAVPSASAQSEIGRLTVRRTMATGKRTTTAGVQPLDSLYPGDSLLRKAFVAVPKMCVGTKRCALAVLMHGSGGGGRSTLGSEKDPLRIFADSEGIICLALTSLSDDRGWGNMHDPKNVDVPRLDAAMRTVLTHYAIDPTRIIIMGWSAGSSAALDWGVVNGDVFSRIMIAAGWAPFTQDHEFDGLHRHGTPAVYIAMDYVEGDALQMPTFVPWMRTLGYAVTYRADSAGHQGSPERQNAGFAWLVHTPGWR